MSFDVRKLLEEAAALRNELTPLEEAAMDIFIQKIRLAVREVRSIHLPADTTRREAARAQICAHILTAYAVSALLEAPVEAGEGS